MPETLSICPKAALAELKKHDLSLPTELKGSRNEFQLKSHFSALSEQLKNAGNEVAAQSIHLLSYAIGLALVLDDAEDPFRFRFVPIGENPSVVSALTQEHVHIFEWLTNEGFQHEPFLRARFSDILWVKARDRTYATIAFESYLLQVQSVDKSQQQELFEINYAIKRACQLWKLLGGNKEKKKQLFEVTQSCLMLSETEPTNYVRAVFFEIISDFDLYDDAMAWLTLVEDRINACKQMNFFEGLRRYIQCAITVSRRIKDKSREDAFRTQLADSYTTEYRRLKESKATPLILQESARKAIEANRQIKGRKELNAQLHVELNAIQVASLEQLVEYSAPFDTTELVRNALDRIKDKNIHEALKIIAGKGTPPSFQELKKAAEKSIKDFPLQSLFPTVRINEKGRTVARQSGAAFATTDEGFVLQKAYEQFPINVTVQGAVINEMRRHLVRRGDNPDEAIRAFLAFNPFVPPGHFEQIRLGLMYGYYGNWIESSHLLLPQIENSVRTLFELNGLLVTSLSASYTQNDHNLNVLLYDKYETDATMLLGEDTHFALKALLVDKLGLNYRNEAMHGLKSDWNYSPDTCAFIWAFFLFLCFTIKPAKNEPVE